MKSRGWFSWLVALSCMAFVESSKPKFVTIPWGRKDLHRKQKSILNAPFMPLQFSRGGSEDRRKPGDTTETEGDDYEYETNEGESIWNSETETQPRKHQVDAESWFEEDGNDQDDDSEYEIEEDLGVDDLDDDIGNEQYGAEDVGDEEVKVKLVSQSIEENISMEKSDEIEPSQDDEGSSPSEVYPMEPATQPESMEMQDSDDIDANNVGDGPGEFVSEQSEFGRTQRRIEMELQQPMTDDDSTAFVDRMELADVEDEGETTAGGDSYPVEGDAEVSSVPAETESINQADDSIEEDAQDASIEADEQAEESQSPPESLHTNESPDSPGNHTDMTDDMKQILRKKLKYRPYEVKCMKPEIAVVLIDKGVKRPLEGMPLNFYREGTGPDKFAAAKQIVGPVIVAAFSSYLALQNPELVTKCVQLTKRRKKESIHLGSSSGETDVVAQDDAVEETDKVDDQVPSATVEEHACVDDSSEIMAETSPPPSIKKEYADETWLDKAITAIGEKLGAVFNAPMDSLKRRK